MNYRAIFEAPEDFQPGAPLDPFDRTYRKDEAGTRVVPSQFSFPAAPMNFLLIRNIPPIKSPEVKD